ncbi:hypothetical protein LL06_15985 [Hoeflea sp. BAL378]|uniref:hypothetical protein n=1 Tax=Hoeflea sp. BAL378 TaxID=1547437 RepID=UPI00051455E2|nr:hypothetical protein [Hoeflea sp. BAL378]KGF68540.1 hypothetical protein LL06_15985 [Hoeflea sp. BAL378]
MKPPRFPADHPDYELEMQMALEPLLIAAIDQARAAGWSDAAILPALRKLVANLDQARTETG